MLKLCSKCKEEKDTNLFPADKSRRDGRRPECRVCSRFRINKWRATEAVKSSRKKYYEENKEYILLKCKTWYEENHERALTKRRAYHATHKLPRRPRKQKAPHEHYLLVRRAYEEKRKKADINYKLAGNLRGRLNRAIRSNLKAGSSVKDLGCSVEYLKQHLERKFQEGTNWSNWGRGHGKWNIDHIVPLHKFNLQDRQHFVLANHYLNLQPLWFEENMAKNKPNTFCLANTTQACLTNTIFS